MQDISECKHQAVCGESFGLTAWLLDRNFCSRRIRVDRVDNSIGNGLFNFDRSVIGTLLATQRIRVGTLPSWSTVRRVLDFSFESDGARVDIYRFETTSVQYVEYEEEAFGVPFVAAIRTKVKRTASLPSEYLCSLAYKMPWNQRQVLVPMKINFVGMLCNCGCWYCMMAAIRGIISMSVTASRRSRGLCAGCGYPTQKTLTKCPECGNSIRVNGAGGPTRDP